MLTKFASRVDHPVISLLVVHGKMEGSVWEAQEEDYS
jgi:hypothetical protein